MLYLDGTRPLSWYAAQAPEGEDEPRRCEECGAVIDKGEYCEGCEMSDDFVSCGRNPNWEKTCRTCRFRNPDLQYDGWGWCSKRNCASVAPTGGCSKHESADDHLDALRDEEGRGRWGI